jgi:HAD superfamily hydrolase (TIGR01509 family)
MDRRYRGVLLDVDGTLVDSNGAHAHAWRDAFAAFGFDVAYEEIRRRVGMGGDHLIESLVGLPPSEPLHHEISARHGERFRAEWLPRIRPIAGARELVIRLAQHGYQYAIASSAHDDELDPLLAIAGVADLCEIRASSSDARRSKPDPDIIEAALARIGVDRTQVLLIGDTPYDVAAARKARIDTIGVRSGGFTDQQLAGAIAVFDDVADLVSRWRESPLAGPGA